MGDAATPTLPDFTSQTASVYKANIDAGFAVADRLAWAFAPHEQDVGSPQPDMTVRLDAGALFDGTTLTEVSAQSTGTITAPTTNPRIDRVVIDESTGAVSVIAGTEAPSPSAPAITAGKLPIARVALVVSQTSIDNADITDERQAQVKPASSFPAGTLMLFHQTAAPTGWTKDTAATLDNAALRVVTSTAWASGKQGATAFDSVFGSGKTAGNYTLLNADVPAHTHDVYKHASKFDGGTGDFPAGATSGSTYAPGTTSSGGGGSHDHTLSLDLNYINMIIASKD